MSNPDTRAEFYGILCDFFERHVFHPELANEEMPFKLTSPEARALANEFDRTMWAHDFIAVKED